MTVTCLSCQGKTRRHHCTPVQCTPLSPGQHSEMGPDSHAESRCHTRDQLVPCTCPCTLGLWKISLFLVSNSSCRSCPCCCLGPQGLVRQLNPCQLGGCSHPLSLVPSQDALELLLRKVSKIPCNPPGFMTVACFEMHAVFLYLSDDGRSIPFCCNQSMSNSVAHVDSLSHLKCTWLWNWPVHLRC